jgi:Protein of unknown function (DUF1592)/Protein of unknown function (DUF1588)/Protein of unknown function (DUF1587)/Protein of unknown function (DUF1585)/Protein of unknown function (DUF1595)/Ca-dependent carbohydrate-binding module xylan-binding/Planctomycete cytochrome C
MQAFGATLLLLLVLSLEPGWAASKVSAKAGGATKVARQTSFEKEIQPLLSRYCYGCHGEKKKGDLDLRIYADAAGAVKDRTVFEKVLKNLQSHEMPPENKPQPTQEEREMIAAWVEAEVFKCDCTKPDPGRVTIRRLNRAEYNNTIRDLMGVSFQPADDFPADDSGYGFDNIGDVLSMPPILMEKYLSAAEKIVDMAIVVEAMPKARTNQFDAVDLDGTAPGGPSSENMRSLNREGDVYVKYDFSYDAEYTLRVRAYGQQAGPDVVRMALLIDDRKIQEFEVRAEQERPEVYETRVKLSAGRKKLAAAYLNNYVNPRERDPKKRDRNLIIDYLEVVVPAATESRPLPESHQRIFLCQPIPGKERECAQKILGHFATRAYRRPATADETERLVKLAEFVRQREGSFERGIQTALQAVLVSPHFLFRGELQPEPNNPQSIHFISEYALASRLSYFLWSSLPDEELFAQAERGTLRRNLTTQVRRMLKDPKSRALVQNFAGQWLQLRNLQLVTPDRQTFPGYDEELGTAMVRESELCFEAIMREDRSVLEFLDADYTFLNERLARHYGIGGVQGAEFRRVSTKGSRRGGVLTQASILTLTSNPTRTSPVKRGKWVLENLLGAPPPPPPPDVPELKEGKEAVLTGTLRQRMEQHRQNPNCATCHARMDPIGFGLENFDGTGAWREQDGPFPIDAAGQLAGGESFNGAADLKMILLTRKKEEFTRCLCDKMLTYALGRGLEFYDKCAIDQISKGVAKSRYKFSSLIMEVVKSVPFQMRRGEGEKRADASH